MGNLRIIADDLGLALCVNEGIILGLKNKWIDGASLMPAGEAFPDAVRLIKELDQPNIGVHIVFVEEKSLGRKKDIPSLIDSDGSFAKGHQKFFFRYMLGLIDLNDIEKEARLQIEKCLEQGIKPSFINSHQHLHLLPRIMDVFIKLAKEYQIPRIRIVMEPIFTIDGGIFRKIKSLVLYLFSRSAHQKIRNNGLETNNFFIGFTQAGDLSLKDIKFAKEVARDYPNKNIELGCHPGFENQQLLNKYRHWGGYHWQKELDVLKK
jgi:predicted glycoside hydrolase/deacetylase ChbG (UPF0249 family)